MLKYNRCNIFAEIYLFFSSFVLNKNKSDISSPMYNGVPTIQSDSPTYYRLMTVHVTVWPPHAMTNGSRSMVRILP